jgi:hypothetical protein
MGARRSIISHGVSFGGGFIAWTVRKSHLTAHIIERITQNARGYRASATNRFAAQQHGRQDRYARRRQRAIALAAALPFIF